MRGVDGIYSVFAISWIVY